MQKISIPYDGKKLVRSKILASKKVRWLRPRSFRAPQSPEVLLKEALSRPQGSRKLAEEKIERAAVICSDNKRLPSPYLPTLLEQLEAKTDDIKLVIACGTHEVPPGDFARKVVGRKFWSSSWYKVRVSSTQNPLSRYEAIGETKRGTVVELNEELLDRDFIISSLCVRPHYFAGWEGGVKALLPGCSSLRTVAGNHSYVIGNPRARELVIDGNPVREDMNEVVSLIEARGINYRIADFVPNQADEPVLIGYGEPVSTHRGLARFGEGLCVVRARSSPLVVTVADGYSGKDLFQSLKAYHLACGIAKPSRKPRSKVILIASLEEGVGGKTFVRELIRYAGMKSGLILEDLKERAVRGDFNETLQKINRIAMDSEKADLAVVSPEAPREVERLMEKIGVPFSRELDEVLKSLPYRDALIIPHGSFTVPV